MIQSAQMQRNMGRNQFNQRQLEREIGRVRHMNQQLLKEDSAANPMKLSRSLLVLPCNGSRVNASRSFAPSTRRPVCRDNGSIGRLLGIGCIRVGW